MKTTALAVLLTLLGQMVLPAHAQAELGESYKLGRESQPGPTLGAEFVFRNDIDEVLIPVYVLGAVAKPGLYHVPARTDLVAILALSGGPTREADTGSVTIRPSGKSEVREVDLEKLLTRTPSAAEASAARSPSLGNNDVVYVKTKEPTISNNTMLMVTVISSVLGIILTGIVVAQQAGK